MKRILSAIAIVLCAISGVALAGHVEPAKANKAQFELVNGFAFCDGSSTNTATQSNGTPACTPAFPEYCRLSATGSGRLKLKRIGSATAGDQDLKITVVVRGIDASCEGGQLHVRLSYRLTTDDCPEGSCTTVDVEDFDLNGAFCVVSGGKCKIDTTLNTVAPGLIATGGKNSGIQIRSCGLKSFGAAFAESDLGCGILLK